MKELFRTSAPYVDNEDDRAHDTLLELVADLPQELADFANLLEKKQVRPTKEIDSYHFTNDTHVMFYAYPSIIKEYMNLYDCSPKSVKVSRGRDNASNATLYQLAVEITCDDGTMVSVSCPAHEPLDHPYAVQFTHKSRDTPPYSCLPSEVGTLLSSIVLSPDQLSDIDEVYRNNERIDEVNPRSPRLQPLLTAPLADKADDFSSSQTYRLVVERHLEDDGESKPAFVLKVDQYANGASAYDISARLHYSDNSVRQRASLHASLEVHSDGSLNAITGKGSTSEQSLNGIQKQELNSGVVVSSIIALLSVKSKEI